jgi:hypothetical protein
MSAPAATIRAMPGDLEWLPAPGAGPAAVAAELTGRIRAELPAIGELGERDQVLVAGWLTGLRSAHTRRYDHSRDSLDRNASYTVAAYLRDNMADGGRYGKLRS